MNPRDSILIPEKRVQARFMMDVRDITKILYQIGVTPVVLIVSF